MHKVGNVKSQNRQAMPFACLPVPLTVAAMAASDSLPPSMFSRFIILSASLFPESERIKRDATSAQHSAGGGPIIDDKKNSSWHTTIISTALEKLICAV